MPLPDMRGSPPSPHSMPTPEPVHFLTRPVLLSWPQAALHPCRDKLQQIDRHLKARRGADAGRDYAKTAELIRKQLDEIQRKADAVAKDAQAKFDSLEKLDMPEEKLERLSNTETQTVQQKEQIRGLSQEVEGELRRAFAALDDVGARLKGEGPGVSVQSYEATLQKTTSQTKAKVNDLLSRMGSLADSDGKTEEAKRLGVAVASYEKMLNTARAMADEIGSLEEQIRLLLKDTGDWARESTVVPGRGGADDKTAVFRPTPQDKTMNMRDTANEMERLKRDYADKKVSDEEYARRLRQLHRTAEVQPEEAATANYKKAHEELKSDAAQAMIDEITRDMCENVTKLTYDMKARKWNEEPLQVRVPGTMRRGWECWGWWKVERDPRGGLRGGVGKRGSKVRKANSSLCVPQKGSKGRSHMSCVAARVRYNAVQYHLFCVQIRTQFIAVCQGRLGPH